MAFFVSGQKIAGQKMKLSSDLASGYLVASSSNYVDNK
jgi:hypothetical protein